MIVATMAFGWVWLNKSAGKTTASDSGFSQTRQKKVTDNYSSLDGYVEVSDARSGLSKAIKLGGCRNL